MFAEDKCQEDQDTCVRGNAEDEGKRRNIHPNNVSAVHNTTASDTKRQRDAEELLHERKEIDEPMQNKRCVEGSQADSADCTVNASEVHDVPKTTTDHTRSHSRNETEEEAESENEGIMEAPEAFYHVKAKNLAASRIHVPGMN